VQGRSLGDSPLSGHHPLASPTASHASGDVLDSVPLAASTGLGLDRAPALALGGVGSGDSTDVSAAASPASHRNKQAQQAAQQQPLLPGQIGGDAASDKPILTDKGPRAAAVAAASAAAPSAGVSVEDPGKHQAGDLEGTKRATSRFVHLHLRTEELFTQGCYSELLNIRALEVPYH
jgi:hypothetical protein